jgi:hypothetical protein
MIWLTPYTAEQIRQRLRDRSPGSAGHSLRGELRGRSPIIVRCTSATAASGSGVGAQCYPGVIVDPKAGDTTQDELGTVWLTVRGVGVESVQPTEDATYLCLLAGNEDIGGDIRPRAFSSASDGEAASSSCSSFLKAGMCATLTTAATEGSCSCVPSQTAALEWDTALPGLTSETLLYGCPPGVVTEGCPGEGGPKKFNLIVAGFTGDFTGFNQNYTSTHTTGETWTVEKNGITVTVTADGDGDWTATLSDGETTVTYEATGVIGCCDEIEFSLTDDDDAEGAPATLTLTPATACGKGPAYRVIVDTCKDACGIRRARMRWVPVAGSGARTITFDGGVCGEADGGKYIEFATDDPLLCSGTDAGGCSDNRLVVRVTCEECVWTEEGYYCYLHFGVQSCAYFAQPPAINEPYTVLLSGPYETSEECTCLTDFSCCDTPMPASYCISVSGMASVDPSFGFLDGSYYFGPNAAKNNVVDGDGLMNHTFAMIVCSGSVFELWIMTGNPLIALKRIALPAEFCENTTWPLAFDSGDGVTGTITTDLSCLGVTSCLLCFLNQSATLELSGGTGTQSANASIGAGFVGFAFPPVGWNLVYTGSGWSFTGGVGGGDTWDLQSESRSGSTVTVVFYNPLSLTTATLTVSIADDSQCGSCASDGNTTYNCVNGTVIPVYDGSGQYATLAAAQSACIGDDDGGGSESFCDGELDAHPNLEVVIALGPWPFPSDDDVGTYSAVWNAGTSRWEFVGSVSGVTYQLWGTVGPPVQFRYNMVTSGEPGGSVTPTCGPFSATFGNLSVTIE